ncbi:spore coat protein U, partial [Escherichia coli]|nr:spore coat protein U [Escherichia coli]
PLLLLPLPSLVAHADPSPISRAFQVQAVVANGCAFGTAISNNAYDLGTLS